MVPPFEVSVFADPSGAFTTAAGMVALTEKYLKDGFDQGLDKSSVVILGGTGPVGVASAVICAKAGANVRLVGRSIEKAEKTAAICNDRYHSKNVVAGADADKQDSRTLNIRMTFGSILDRFGCSFGAHLEIHMGSAGGPFAVHVGPI